MNNRLSKFFNGGTPEDPDFRVINGTYVHKSHPLSVRCEPPESEPTFEVMHICQAPAKGMLVYRFPAKDATPGGILFDVLAEHLQRGLIGSAEECWEILQAAARVSQLHVGDCDDNSGR